VGAGVAVRSKTGQHPRHFILQWHITDRCNLRCAHCYQDGLQDDLPFGDLLIILDQFKSFLAKRNPQPIKGHINITGGEPFFRKDFFDLLDCFHAERHLFSFAVLTNGSLLEKGLIRKLKASKPRFVQLSLDGLQQNHDRIRGEGNFKICIAAIRRLVAARIPVLVSFTAHKDNAADFPAVVKLVRRLKVARVWADRLIPAGAGAAFKERIFDVEDTRRFFESMARVRGGPLRRFFSRTDVAMHRALQFLIAAGKPYHCTAGDTLLTVMPNGDLFPCRRMPIYVGNLFETPLAVLYTQSQLLRKLRNPESIPAICRACSHAHRCRGGLRCLSHAVTGSPFHVDPGCWVVPKAPQEPKAILP